MSTVGAPRVVDLSHPITDGMRSYPGIPGPAISAFLTHEQSRSRYDGQCELTFSHVDIVAGVGTYLDAPYHRDAALPDHGTLPLSVTADVPGLVIDLTRRSGRPIAPDALGDPARWRDHAVILRSGMEDHWDSDRYWTEWPYLTEDAARLLAGSGLTLLGVDFLNVDDTGDPRRPAHTALLRAGIPIIENLCNVGRLPASGFRLHAATLPLSRVASFPVRAYAVVDP